MKLARILFFACLFGLAPCFGVQAQKVEILTGADKNEVLLYFDTPYTLTPRTTLQDEYKGVIFDNASAMRQNKRISGSFLSEVQVFNITESLYILGVGNPKEMEVEVSVSKDLQTYKIVFKKITPPPTHLEMLMNKTLQTSPAQGAQTTQKSDAQSDISAQMLTLPKPPNFVQNEPKEINLHNLKEKQNSQGTLDSQNPQNTQNPQNRAQTQAQNPQNSAPQENTIKESAQTTQTTQDSQNILLPFGKNILELETWRYLAVIGVMVLLVLVLLWVKGFLKPKERNFASLLAQNGVFQPNGKNLAKGKNLKVSLQKRIDSKNNLVVIEAGNYRYLVLMGEHGNTLLDRYNANGASEDVNIQNNLIIEDSQFAKLLEQKEQRLKRLQNDQRI
ncbi:hypothetical protein CQA49_08535 [Helicobacter sp. MIT 00-7814]|uniref:hypothetical protein n=1 Tax=unclassified Helicobacter TaxID=2593540 RepID=UPI000E1F1C86|nr:MULTISPECIES: hypothetical protein [unclassified Helicobacter]RDU52271.1 hypothetical protein CQA49_08535 [Helicobacter sp. MIT 00-7814]RDU52296.1 hypothetical protein CQA37_08720 [Helicobacter sp. MIT 99-10781]